MPQLPALSLAAVPGRRQRRSPWPQRSKPAAIRASTAPAWATPCRCVGPWPRPPSGCGSAPAIRELFSLVRREIKRHGCQRTIVTAHNAHFDDGFIHAAAHRNGVKRSPSHPFSVMDTVGLAALAYGHTVLGEACTRAGIGYASERAHSAVYDADVTARLFCAVVNGAGEIPWAGDASGS